MMMENIEGKKNDLFVRVKATRLPKQNTSSEASEEVVMIAVEVSEAQTEDSESIELNIHIQRRAK